MMPQQADQKRGTLGSIIKGMALLAVGNKEGLNCFSNSVDGFLASLAPQLACIVIGSIQIFIFPQKTLVLTKIMLAVCVLLIPPVISQFYAQFWKRNNLWLRYVTAATWCSWVVVLFSMLCTIFAMSLAPDYIENPLFLEVLALVSAIYEFWLQWFIAKDGLDISAPKAFILFATIVLCIIGLYTLVAIFPPHYYVINDLIQPMAVVKAH